MRLISPESIWHPIIGWILWGVAVAFVEHILWIYWESIDRSLVLRIVYVTVISVPFLAIASYSTYSDWKQQMASALEGDLIGAGPALNDGKQHGFPNLRIGGTTMVMSPNGVPERFKFFPDANIRIEWGFKGPQLTTTVRDRNGNLVVEVTRNHWRVYPLYSVDKNYTQYALEVEDSAGHVVLQVRIFPDTVELQGEWWDTQGNGIRFLKPPGITPDAGAIVIPLGPRNQHTESLIQPIFQYPSKEHWRELLQ